MARETLRVEQIDARILDGEFRQIALSQLEATIGSLPVALSRAVEVVKPEIELAVDAVLWSPCIAEGASPGQLEEDIAYKDYTTKKVIANFSLAILLPYLSKRIPQIAQKPNWQKMVCKAEAVWQAISILHYLRFLRRGGHSSILEEILGLRNWNNNLPTIGTINYESQNRELLWHAFRDALLLSWPVLVAVQRIWQRRVRPVMQSSSNELQCMACTRDAITPVSRSCGHVTCYWCDASRKEEGCVVCGITGQATVVKGRRVL